MEGIIPNSMRFMVCLKRIHEKVSETGSSKPDLKDEFL